VSHSNRRLAPERSDLPKPALHYAILNLAGLGKNIVSAPQLDGNTHTLFAHVLLSLGVKVRFAERDDAAAIESRIDADTRAIFCESVAIRPATSAMLKRLRMSRTSTTCCWDNTMASSNHLPTVPRVFAGAEKLP
jgi:O-acetylhomoserine/O-acetylserine sulfhydrylase-like pyridoxal-dependent enzyme